jgi:hypothetical protein
MVTKAQRERQERTAGAKRKKRALVFTILSLPADFGSWGYFVVAANPSFYFGMALFFVAAAFLSIAVFEYFRGRWVRAIFIVGILVCFWLVGVWAESEWIKKVNSDIQSNLDVSISIPSSGDPLDPMLTVVNNSHTDLANHEVNCLLVKLFVGRLHIAEDISTKGIVGNGPLRIGGDADTRGCLTFEGVRRSIRVLNAPPNVCEDVKVQVHYRSEDSLPVEGVKEARFVYGYLGNNSWLKESNDRKTSYCVKPPL